MKPFDENLLKALGKKFTTSQTTIAVAESVTSGALQLALSSIPNASNFFQGGITAYNLGQKYKHLHVEPIHASRVNCVSAQVAEQMAIYASQLFQSDWSIGITGYASPVPESGNKLFAHYAIAFKGKIKSSGKIIPKSDTPEDIQFEYADFVLRKLKGPGINN
ncbi:MAG: CinA family protein [Chitinophagaceae bacterium]|nr:CinA family protein [Chitinophagaceae bacterium]